MQWSIRSLKAIKTTSTINSLKNTTKQHDMVPSVFVNKKKDQNNMYSQNHIFSHQINIALCRLSHMQLL